MSETDPGPLATSKMELAVTIINGSPRYAKSPVLARRLPHLLSVPTLLLALAIILLSLLYIFAFKPDKICTRNSINGFSYLFVHLYLRLFFRLSVNFL